MVLCIIGMEKEMTQRKTRLQIFLEPQQRRRLQALARREGKSFSAVAREVIEAGLESLENQIGIWQRRSRVIDRIKAVRDQQPFIYSGNLIHDIRQERENEQEQVWRAD